MCNILLTIESLHPHLRIIHIHIHTQAHAYSKYQNKTGIIVLFLNIVLIYTLNLLVIYQQ